MFEYCSPSKLALLVGRRRTGSIPTPSIWGDWLGNLHWRHTSLLWQYPHSEHIGLVGGQSAAEEQAPRFQGAPGAGAPASGGASLRPERLAVGVGGPCEEPCWSS